MLVLSLASLFYLSPCRVSRVSGVRFVLSLFVLRIVRGRCCGRVRDVFVFARRYSQVYHLSSKGDVVGDARVICA